jgi:anti-sigma-K factor RskA
MAEIQPPGRIWQRLESDLELARNRTPCLRRVGFWQAWAAAATVALVLALGLQFAAREPEAMQLVQIARLSGKNPAVSIAAHLSRDGRSMLLRATRPLLAGPNQSYELWLIPAADAEPISLAVLGSLDARFTLAPAHAGKLRPGATLAVSAEPAGGSPTGKPTGAVILAGRIAG